MQRLGRATRSPFASALLGGLVVAGCGWLAIAAGWVEAEAETSSVLAPPSLTAPAADGAGKGASVNEIYRRASPGVALVRATQGDRAGSKPGTFGPFGPVPRPGPATGSAFVIDREGHLLTNAHVVQGAEQVQVTLGEGATTLRAEVLGTDSSTDVAVLRVEPPEEGLNPLPLGDSDEVRVGDAAVAIGNPFGLDRTATAGIVSAVQREISAPDGYTISEVIQTDAPINPGNSGGPLLDAAGRVIGINSQIETPGAGNVGIGFAVPINTARQVSEQLLEDGSVEHAFLGITGADVTSEVANVLNLAVEQGALVQEVVPDGPAAKAGIEAGSADVRIEGQELRAGGDIITMVDGEPVTGMDDVVAAVNALGPGDDLELTLVRGDDERTATVTLGDRPPRAVG